MAVQATVPFINGVAYSHADIVFVALGAPIVGLKSISYSEVQAIENNYGTGHFPVSRGHGAVTVEASITLSKESFDQLVQSAPNRKIQNIPSGDIQVNYISQESGLITTDVLKSAKFKGPSQGSEVENSEIEVEIELSIASIIYDKQ